MFDWIAGRVVTSVLHTHAPSRPKTTEDDVDHQHRHFDSLPVSVVPESVVAALPSNPALRRQTDTHTRPSRWCFVFLFCFVLFFLLSLLDAGRVERIGENSPTNQPPFSRSPAAALPTSPLGPVVLLLSFCLFFFGVVGPVERSFSSSVVVPSSKAFSSIFLVNDDERGKFKKTKKKEERRKKKREVTVLPLSFGFCVIH